MSNIYFITCHEFWLQISKEKTSSYVIFVKISEAPHASQALWVNQAGEPKAEHI